MTLTEGVTFGYALAVDMLPVRLDPPDEPDFCDYLDDDDGLRDARKRWYADVCACRLLATVDDLRAYLTVVDGSDDAQTASDDAWAAYEATNAEMLRRAQASSSEPTGGD